MASNTTSVDPRLINPLICNPENGLASFAADTLNRVASTLELFSVLIGSHSGELNPFGDEDQRFAFSLQLDGMAGTLRATGDALLEDSKTAKEGAK